MGSFSFTYAPITRKQTIVENITHNGSSKCGADSFICLIPKHLDGGSIIDTAYQDYGMCDKFDMLALITAFNTPREECWDLLTTHTVDDWNKGFRCEVAYTSHNGLEYPLKLVPYNDANLSLTYEDVEGISLDDYGQGFDKSRYLYDWSTNALGEELD